MDIRQGSIWSAVERFSVQGVQFLVLIIMARVLTPDDYGLVGMLTVFIAVAQSLVDSGFSQALIRKRHRSPADNSTVFYFNVAAGLILYGVMCACAPAIARFYGQPQLVPLTCAVCLNIVFNSLVVVQRALLTVTIDFKTQAKATLTAAIVSGVAGIWMAYTGWGVWSIVAQSVGNVALSAALLWLLSSWRPTWEYSWVSFREMFGFGSKIAVSGLLETLYRNAYLLVIGKLFNAGDLGQYTRASQFAEFPSTNLTGVVQRVSYPVLCAMGGDMKGLLAAYKRQLRMAAFAIFPVMMLIAGVAQPLVVVLLNPSWAPAGIMLEILCFAMMWYPVHSLNLNLLMVLGRSGMFLKAEVWKKVIGVMLLCATVPLGVDAMCAGLVLASVAALIVNSRFLYLSSGFGFWPQMRQIAPSMAYALILYSAAKTFTLLTVNPLWGLLMGGLGGTIIFFLITWATRSTDLRHLLTWVAKRKEILPS